MSTPRLLVTRSLPIDVEEKLKVTFETIFLRDGLSPDSEKLIKQLESVDGILCTPCDQIGADLISRLPTRIRIISTFSVGFEHIDIEAAKARGIIVTNTPGVLTDATADIAMLLMLGASRRAYEGQSMVRAGQWTGWTPTQLLGTGLQGKVLGLVGMGRIGQAVAERAMAFGMQVHYHNRKPVEGCDYTYHPNLKGLLAVSQFLSLHCPLTTETKGLLNHEALQQLPDGAIVVNTARGGVVDDEALIAALQSGKVAAAGLDVFEGEPNLHQGYVDLPNVYLLPHLGSATVETRNAMGFCAIDNLVRFFEGKAVSNPV